MTSRLPGLICSAWLLASGPSAFAAASVQLIGLDYRVEATTRIETPPLPAVFGNRSQGLTLEMGPVSIPTASLHADLLQVSGAMAMPLQKDIPLPAELTFPTTAPKCLSVSIKFPNVKRQTQILARFYAEQTGGIRTLLGDLRFDVFPTSLTKDLADLLATKTNELPRVVIFGSGNKLRTFFQGVPIAFEDGGTSRPDRLDPNRLYFCETTDKDQVKLAEDRRAGGHLAVFSPDETLPPGIYAETAGPGVFIRATLPFLDHLSDDPRAQLAFIKIIQLLSNPASSNRDPS